MVYALSHTNLSLFYSTQKCLLLNIKVLWMCVLVAVCIRQEMVHMGRHGTPELPYCKPDTLYCIVFGCIFVLVSFCCTQLHTAHTPLMSSSILVLCHFQASGCLSEEAGNGPRVTVDTFDSPRQVLFLAAVRPQLTQVRVTRASMQVLQCTSPAQCCISRNSARCPSIDEFLRVMLKG